MPERTPWFSAKSHGYGAGLPVAWQGWVLIAGYFVVLGVAGWLDRLGFASTRIAALILFITATATLIVLAARHTQGGWKWRWGKRD